MRTVAVLLATLALTACKPTPDEPADAVEPVVPTTAQTTGAPADPSDEPTEPKRPEARPDQCPERKPAEMIVGAKDGCATDADCRSHVCGTYRGGATGTCIDAPDGCATRFIGRVIDATTMQPVPGADLIARHAYVKKLDSLVAVGESKDDGTFDFASEGEIEGGGSGVMMEAAAPGFAPTRTLMMWKNRRTGKYPAANRTRDVWLIPTDALAAWNKELAKVAPKEMLPLGKKTATVVVTRDQKGEIIAGATVVSFREERSKSKVFYLQKDGTFGGDSSSESGIAIILGANGGEDFGVGADKHQRCEVRSFLAIMSDAITVAGCIP